MKNYFVTGQKGSGKSFLIQKIRQHLNWKEGGYLTLPYFIEGKKKGYYFHSLVTLKENDIPFTVQISETECIPISEIFCSLGVSCLQESRKQNVELLILDEIGRVEQKEPDFLEEIRKTLDGKKFVLGALKKESIGIIEEIKNRPDVVIYDLDLQAGEQVYYKILEDMEGSRK